MIPWWYTEFGEPEKLELLKAFSEKRFTISKSVDLVERMMARILDVPYVVLTNSGSSALLMAFLAIDLQSDDEVIVPALTWIATPQAPAILKARVVMCDCQEDRPIIDVKQLEKLITKKTKAFLPVHLNGRACDMDAINELAKSVGAYVIEDTCKGLFSRNHKGYLGTLGDMGCFSLGMISPISIGYGGMVVTRNKALYEKLKMIRDHGVQRQPESYCYLGYNFKISDLLASMAVPQLEAAETRINHLVNLHDYYEQHLNHPYLTIVPVDKKSGGVPVYVEGRSSSREEIIAFLNKNNIQVSRYHLPINRASYLKAEGQFPHAKALADECFILPSGPAQPLHNVQIVVEQLNAHLLCGV